MHEELEQRLRFCGNLPSLPAVALKMVDMANNPEVELADVARVLSMDPALVTKLFRAANSPLYGAHRKINNLRQVLGMIGLQGTLALALGFSLLSTGKDQKIPLNADHFWRRSLLTATACRFLGERLSIKNLEELFLAGLLQSIGVLALALIMPSAYAPLLQAATTPAVEGSEEALDYQRLAQLEREHFSSDHAAAGAWLLRHWRLPEYLCQATAASLDPDQHHIIEKYLPLVRCVALATRMADILVAPDYAQDSWQVAELAHTWFAMESALYVETLDAVGFKFPEIATLFQIKPLDGMQITGIVDQAREALEIRTVQRWPSRLGSGTTQSSTVAPSLPKHLPDVPVALSARHLGGEQPAAAVRSTYTFDALTGLFARQYLHKRLRKELLVAQQRRQPLSIVLIDLDSFAAINEASGRSIGDQILIALSRILDSNMRRQDWVTRYGSDEFALTLSNTAADAAHHTAEQLLSLICNWEPELSSGHNLRVTATAGVASYGGRGRIDDGSGWLLLAAAEQALAAAKQQGGNQIMVAPSEI